MGSDDMRSYKLIVENVHGIDSLQVNLTIEDPIPMAAVVGLTLAILIIFLILVIALLVAYKKEKMCFKRKRESLKSASTSSTLHYVDPMTISNKSSAKVSPLP